MKKIYRKYLKIVEKIKAIFSKKRLKLYYIWMHKYKVNIGVEPKWSLREKIKYNRLGFTNEDYFIFNLKENDYKNYISFWERLRLEGINGRLSVFLGEKLMFERIFGNFIGVPHINCWVKNATFIDMDAGKPVDIISILKSKKKLISKPTRSVGGGTGIHKIEYINGKTIIDDKECSSEQFLKETASWEEYIFVDYINQAKYSDKIFSETVNTIRIITAIRKTGDFEVVLAVHRFGTEQSKPVDNASSGGIFASINIETGVLSSAVRETEPDRTYFEHPDTEAQIEGIIIPNWEHIKQKVLSVHRRFPYYSFLAWDIVQDENGDTCVLEINRGSDLMWQMITPLRHEPLGEFMRENGLLDKW